MKYPFLSNWIIYKKVPDQDAYYVKNMVLHTETVIVPNEMMEFAEKLDGKTNPYSVSGKSISETKAWINELNYMNVIRTDHGVLSGGRGFHARMLIRTRNTKFKRALSKILNAALMISFIPSLVFGAFVYLSVDEFGYREFSVLGRIVYSHPTFSSVFLSLSFIVFGAAIHEACHGIACRAYGGRVFEYGAMINILPCFYTLMNESRVRSRLKKIQISAAGVEGNLLFVGILLLLTGVLPPELKSILGIGASLNVLMTLINVLAIKGMDGLNILLLLLGMESMDIDDIKCMTKRKNRRILFACEGYDGVAKLIVCYMITSLQWLYPIMILLEVIAVIGCFL